MPLSAHLSDELPALVTGATGFVGRHLVRALAERGHTVTALARTNADISDLQGVRWQRGDIIDQRYLADVTRSVSVVYHLAAIVPAKGGQSAQWRINCEGTRMLLQACIENGVKRLVFLSSVCAYAPPLKTLIDEDCPIGGGDSYGRSKAAAELEIINGAPSSSLCHVILRPCQVYGPGDRSGFTALMMRMLGSNYVFTAGHTPRSFSLVFVGDLVEAIIRAGTSPISSSCTVNIAGPSLASLQTLVSAYSAITGHAAKHVPLPAAAVRFAQELRWFSRNLAADAMRPRWRSYKPDNVYGSLLLGGPEYALRRAKLEFGFEPRISVRDGLANILCNNFDDSVSGSNARRDRPWDCSS